MKFRNVQCRFCGRDVFDIEEIIAYSPGMVLVDLKGEQPWSGIHCVCETCVHAFLKMLGPVLIKTWTVYYDHSDGWLPHGPYLSESEANCRLRDLGGKGKVTEEPEEAILDSLQESP